VIRSSKQPDNDYFLNGVADGFWLPPANNISPMGKTNLHSNTMWYDSDCIVCHIREIGVQWVHFLMMSPPVGDIWYPKCTANLYGVGVIIIMSQITFAPVPG